MAKKQLNSHFPHISRIINAEFLASGLKAVVFIGLLAFLAFNLLPPLPGNFFGFEQAKLATMIEPKDFSSHLLLSQEYLKRGNLEAVERELTLAQNLEVSQPQTTSPSVLGLTLSPVKIWQKIVTEPQRIKEEITFWKKIVAEKPDYRDAYLQLAILNYQIYDNRKATGYLNKALELDPNFGPSKQLEKIVY